MKRPYKYCMDRQKGRSRSNRMILINLNVSNRMKSIHSNVTKFLKNNT